MKTATIPTRTIELAAAQMLNLDSRRARRVRVLCGEAWLTSEDELGDSVLHAGEELTLPPGRTLLEALGPARLQLSEATSPWPGRWLPAWRRLRRHAARWQFGAIAAQA